MILHLNPSIYLKYSNVTVDLIDFSIPEMSLNLKGGVDLMVKTPYPNKCYKVLCRKKGKKAINGFLLDVETQVRHFTMITRWSVRVDGGDVREIDNVVHFHIGDNDFDFVSSGKIKTGVFIDDLKERLNKPPQGYKYIYKDGMIRESHDYLLVETKSIENARCFDKDRFPSLSDAFKISLAELIQDKQTLVPTKHASSLGCFAGEILDLYNDYENSEDGIDDVKAVLSEIMEECDYFFTNSNDLVNKAKLYSAKYLSLGDDVKKMVDDCITQPLFTITSEIKDGTGTILN